MTTVHFRTPSTPQKETLWSQPIPLLPLPESTTDPLCLDGFAYSGHFLETESCVWLLFLWMMLSRSTHIARISASFLLMPEYFPTMSLSHIVFIHEGCLHLWALVKSAAMTVQTRVLYKERI